MNHAQRQRLSELLSEVTAMAHSEMVRIDDAALDLIAEAQRIVDTPDEDYLITSDSRLDIRRPYPFDMTIGGEKVTITAPEQLYPQMVGRAQRAPEQRTVPTNETGGVYFLDTPSRGIDLDHIESIWHDRDIVIKTRKRLIAVGLSIAIMVSILLSALTSDTNAIQQDSTAATPTVAEDTVRAKLPTRSNGAGPRHRLEP